MQVIRSGSSSVSSGFPPLPSSVLVRTTEVLGMKNLGENFGRLHQARPRTVEKLIAVGEEHLPLLHGLQPRAQIISVLLGNRETMRFMDAHSL